MKTTLILLGFALSMVAASETYYDEDPVITKMKAEEELKKLEAKLQKLRADAKIHLNDVFCSVILSDMPGVEEEVQDDFMVRLWSVIYPQIAPLESQYPEMAGLFDMHGFYGNYPKQ